MLLLLLLLLLLVPFLEHVIGACGGFLTAGNIETSRMMGQQKGAAWTVSDDRQGDPSSRLPPLGRYFETTAMYSGTSIRSASSSTTCSSQRQCFFLTQATFLSHAQSILLWVLGTRLVCDHSHHSTCRHPHPHDSITLLIMTRDMSNVIMKVIVSPASLCRLWIMLCLVVRTIQQVAQEPPLLNGGEEEIWENGDLGELHKHLHCNDDPIATNHTTATWKLLQSTYESIVKDQSSLPPGGFLGVDGFYVPYEIVEHEDHGGLMIVATKPIRKGTLIWKSIRTARFLSGKDYRQFLRQLPPALGCEVLKWAYTRWEQDHMVACVDFDPGSLIKECNGDNDDDDEDDYDDCTLRIASPRSSGCNLQFVANRDIDAGEEFRMDYSFAEMDPGWTMLGMWREVVEEDDEEDGKRPEASQEL